MPRRGLAGVRVRVLQQSMLLLGNFNAFTDTEYYPALTTEVSPDTITVAETNLGKKRRKPR